MVFQTDLAHHNPFTEALKNFGNKTPNKDKGNFLLLIPTMILCFVVLVIDIPLISCFKSIDIEVEIRKAGKALTPLQLEREYQDWILQMHDLYDEEVDSGEDHPVIIVSPANKNALGISSDGKYQGLTRLKCSHFHLTFFLIPIFSRYFFLHYFHVMLIKYKIYD